MSQDLIISASRRTDMPRFYLDVLAREVRERWFRWHHPFDGRPRELRLAPDQQAVLVLWSKDFGPFLRHHEAFEGWPLFFHFTITTPAPALEPDLPPLEERLRQMEALLRRWGPRAVRWRFDPIVVWETGGQRFDNLRGLPSLAREIARLGVREVTISFMDRYRKIDRRTSPSSFFHYLPETEQVALFAPVAQALQDLGFTISTCCEPHLPARIPGVKAGRCIDAPLLSSLSGRALEAAPDRGQRRSKGCLCHASIDVGCYIHHRCLGRCWYCYARP